MEQTIEQQEALVLFGGAVKALGDGKIGGYLVTFSGKEDPDLSEFRDFFTAETDFDLEDGAGKASVYYAHGQDPHLGKRRLGKATLKADDAGVWAETQLALRDAYEQAIYKLAQAGKLAWSSGSTSHLVERKSVGDAHQVLHWPISEASLTPTPAEPRCGAVALKSLAVPDLLEDEARCEACAAKGAERSLAARTDAACDTLSDLLAGYQQVAAAEAKAGRPQLSTARRSRLEQARQLIDDLLTETTARDEPAEEAATTEATGMDAASATPAAPTGGDFYAPTVSDILGEVGWLETQRL